MDKLKIVAIVGSLRKNSYNLQLARMAEKIVGERADFEILEYADVPFMNQDIEFPAPEAVRRVRETIKSADGIWFFTPEYNHSFPGVLKNLIDWLSRQVSDSEPQVLNGKPAAISGIGLGMSGTGIVQDHLVALISFLNMKVMNVPRLTVPNAWQLTNEADEVVLTEGIEFLQKQTEAFLDFI